MVNNYKYLGTVIGNSRNIHKDFEKDASMKLKRSTGVIKMKARESFNRNDVAETLWEYVGLNGSLYGAEMGIYTEEGIRKMKCMMVHVERKVNIGTMSTTTVSKLLKA